MENISLILLSGLLISAVSVIGVLIIKTHAGVARFVSNNLRSLTAISAGIFLVTSYLLIQETLEILGIFHALLAFLGGIILYIILHKVLSPHRHDEDHTHSHDHKKSAWKILIGDSVHNIADGLLLVASFGAGTSIGISNALSIALHEVPQEISEFLVLKKSGYSNIEATYRNLASALSIFVGIAIGIFLVQSALLQAYLLGITATFFLGIVFTDLFPVQTILRNKELPRMLSALILGVIIMTSISSALGHSHEHSHTEHEDEVNFDDGGDEREGALGQHEEHL